MEIPQRPDEVEWELNRPLLTQLWSEQGGTVHAVRNHMQRWFGWKAPINIYKSHFKKWGLFKNFSIEEVLQILENDDAAKQDGQACIHFLRGQLVDIQEVRAKHARNMKEDRIKSVRDKSQKRENLTSIVTLRAPLFLDEPPFSPSLGLFAKVFRETHLLLQSCATSGACKPGLTGLYWQSLNAQMQAKSESLKLTIWYGVKYHMEKNIRAANLCWEEASLLLEELYMVPDLDMWTTLIRCCAELERYDVPGVSIRLLTRLKDLCQSLRPQSLHKALIDALVTVDAQTIFNGLLYFLEFKLKTIQNLWPADAKTHFPYRLDLAEARIQAAYLEEAAELPTLEQIDLLFKDWTWHHAQIQAYRISVCALRGDTRQAEAIATQFVVGLENRRSECSTEVEFAAFSKMLADLQFCLGWIEPAKRSLLGALMAHQKAVAGFHDIYPLSSAEKHQILHFLNQLSTPSQVKAADGEEKQRHIQTQLLESQWASSQTDRKEIGPAQANYDYQADLVRQKPSRNKKGPPPAAEIHARYLQKPSFCHYVPLKLQFEEVDRSSYEVFTRDRDVTPAKPLPSPPSTVTHRLSPCTITPIKQLTPSVTTTPKSLPAAVIPAKRPPSSPLMRSPKLSSSPVTQWPSTARPRTPQSPIVQLVLATRFRPRPRPRPIVPWC